jgi:glyoxylase-like metal-dependent hydrolase (beta-lactamase superfamily II)
MKYLKVALCFFIYLSSLLPTFGQEKDIAPVLVQKISDRTAVFCNSQPPLDVNVTAINTGNGIVVIDTSNTPQSGRRIRKAIEKEFPGTKITKVINTHHHWDHTFGNQSFSDALIISHENCPKGMAPGYKKGDHPAEWQKGFIDNIRKNREKYPAGSEQAREMDSRITYLESVYNELSEGFVPTRPVITFREQLNFYQGDLTFHLYSMGTIGSNSDIYIYVPEEKLLHIGDSFSPELLFASWSELITVPRWIEILDVLFKDKNSIEKVVNGHSKKIFSGREFERNHKYIKKLWENIGRIKDEKTLEQALESLSLENYFPEVLKNFGDNEQVREHHKRNVTTFWKVRKRRLK